ncbi:D-threo-aldose 1-dehydrogenase [Friedmanniella luteola]|uniref:D-threo-aldose 1-dehydrogenase n=1 Tax=Friedmanniella luteola TaxID=546871 RepID=A0A1H1ZPN5_9ACTN|nr:aldo/keto reductase [Friedmanniella luteola]SDT35547.1 D-threo-aldose 1-dehydrogenase [Friedmanniella luteola]
MTAPGSEDWLRPLGRTGLQVTAVAVGGAPLGSMPENFGHEVAYDDGVALAAYVLDSPVRVLDTSNGYSGGESERRIGAAIAQRGGVPADFLVTTKVDARGTDYSGARVRASVAESRQRLGLDQLPLVYLHDPEFHDFDELSAPGGAVDTLMALRDEGVIGHVGLAGGTAQEMQRYLALGGFEVLLVHNRWTLVDRSATELVAQAEDLGVALVNAAVYGGGLLAKPGSTTKYGYREASPVTLQAVEAMRAVCAEHGTDLATAALQASVRDPRVSTTVVGLSRPARLDALVASLGTALPDALFDTLEELRPPREHWLDFSPS